MGMPGWETGRVGLCRQSARNCRPAPQKSIPYTANFPSGNAPTPGLSPLPAPPTLPNPTNQNQSCHSTYGQTHTVRAKNPDRVAHSDAFWPRLPAEMEFLRARRAALRFTESSSLARIGIAMVTTGRPVIDGNRLALSIEGFLYGHSFPNAAYWQK